jgi:hypothetical protein
MFESCSSTRGSRLKSKKDSAACYAITERWRASRRKRSPSALALARRTGSTRRYTLQIDLSTFVGRQRELAEISYLCAGSRVLTLTGTGISALRIYGLAEGLVKCPQVIPRARTPTCQSVERATTRARPRRAQSPVRGVHLG